MRHFIFLFLVMALHMAVPQSASADHPTSGPADIRVSSGQNGFNRTLNVQWDLDGTLEFATKLGAWKPVDEPVAQLRTGYKSVTLEYSLGTFPKTIFFRVRLADQEPDEHIHVVQVTDPFVPGRIVQQVQPAWQISRPQPVYSIRLHLVLCSDTFGNNRVTLSTNDFQQYVDQANTIFFRSGIRFEWHSIADVSRISNSALNSDVTPLVPLTQLTNSQAPPVEGVHYSGTNNAAQRSAFAQTFKGKLVVYSAKFGSLIDRKFSWDSNAGHWKLSDLEGGKSSWSGNMVTIGGSMRGLDLLAHEIGHYLNNMHTFPGVGDPKSYIAQKLGAEEVSPAQVPSLFDADSYWVRDTPPDPGPEFLKTLNDGNSCVSDLNGTFGVSVYYGAYEGYHTFSLLPDRLNLQSYHRCPDLGVLGQSPDQIARLRDALENRHRHHLIAQHMGSLVGAQLTETGTYLSGITSRPDLRLLRTRYDQLVMLRRRTSDDAFQLLALKVETNGMPSYQTLLTGEPCKAAEFVHMGLGLVAVSFITPDDRPGIRVYRLDSDYTWTTHGTWYVALNYVQQIAVARYGRLNLALACRTSEASDNTYIYALTVDANGAIQLQSYNEAGTSSSIALAPAGARWLGMARRDSGGSLLMETYEISEERAKGATLKRLSATGAGAIGRAELMALDEDTLVSPVPTSAGDMKLIHWALDPAGKLARVGNGTTITGVEQWDTFRLSTDLIAVAARTSTDGLAVRVYESQPDGESNLRQANSGQIVATSAAALPAVTMIRAQHLGVARLNSDGRPEVRIYYAAF